MNSSRVRLVGVVCLSLGVATACGGKTEWESPENPDNDQPTDPTLTTPSTPKPLPVQPDAGDATLTALIVDESKCGSHVLEVASAGVASSGGALTPGARLNLQFTIGRSALRDLPRYPGVVVSCESSALRLSSADRWADGFNGGDQTVLMLPASITNDTKPGTTINCTATPAFLPKLPCAAGKPLAFAVEVTGSKIVTVGGDDRDAIGGASE